MNGTEELLSVHRGQYITLSFPDCGLSADEKKCFINIGNQREADRPIQAVFFDRNHGNSFITAFSDKQPGKASVAMYVHSVICRDVSAEDIRKNSLEDIVSNYGYAGKEDIDRILSNKVVFDHGWERAALSEIRDQVGPKIDRNLLIQLVCDCLYIGWIGMSQKIYIAVPNNIDMVTAFRSTVKQILSIVPYGLWPLFSFSENASDGYPEYRFIFVREGVLINKEEKLYNLTDKPDRVNSPLLKGVIEIVKRCAEDKAYKDWLNNNFESKYSCGFPSVIEYDLYYDAVNICSRGGSDSSCFKNTCDFIKKCEKSFLSDTAIASLTGRIDSADKLSAVLTSADLGLADCSTFEALDEKLGEYSRLLGALKVKGVMINRYASDRLLAPASDNLNQMTYKELDDFLAKLNSSENIKQFLEPASCSALKAKIDKAEELAADREFTAFENSLRNAVSGGDVDGFERQCEEMSQRDYVGKMHARFENAIADPLCDIDSVGEVGDCFRKIASKYITNEKLKAVDYAIREAKNRMETLRGMQSFGAYLHWIVKSESEKKHISKYLDAVFDNLAKTEYENGSVKELVYAARIECGEYDFDKETVIGGAVDRILSDERMCIVLKDKPLAEVYEELLFCKSRAIYQIRCLTKDGKQKNTIVSSASEELARLLNGCSISNSAHNSGKDFYRLLYDNCDFKGNERERKILDQLFVKQKASNNIIIVGGNKKGNSAGRHGIVGYLIMGLLIVVLIAVVVVAVILVLKNRKESNGIENLVKPAETTDNLTHETNEPVQTTEGGYLIIETPKVTPTVTAVPTPDASQSLNTPETTLPDELENPSDLPSESPEQTHFVRPSSEPGGSR